MVEELCHNILLASIHRHESKYIDGNELEKHIIDTKG